MSNKLIKFELPVGATLCGMRHLGGGVFAGDVMPEKKDHAQKMPVLFEVVSKDVVAGVLRIPAEVIEDPFAGEGNVSLNVALIDLIGSDGKALPSEGEWAEAIGLSKDEFFRRQAAWEQPTREKPHTEHECCGKCHGDASKKGGEAKKEPGKTAEDLKASYEGVINELAQRLREADAVITAMVLQAGGSITVTGTDAAAVVEHAIESTISEDRSSFTFRAVPLPQITQQ